MADNEALVNGVNGDSSDLYDADHPAKKTTSVTSVDELNQRIEALEKEKSDLERQNSQSEAKIGELQVEIETLRMENAESESNRRAAEAIAKRAAELEGHVVRLEHDYITAMNEGAEASREVQQLTAMIRELGEKAKREKEERESEITTLRREKKEVEDSVGELKTLLKESEDKVKQMEEKMDELVKKSEESDNLINGLMETIAEREANIPEAVDEKLSDDGFKGLKAQLPVIGAVSAGVVIVAAAAACYVRHK